MIVSATASARTQRDMRELFELSEQIVFIKNKEGFTAVPVNILAEDNMHYYIESNSRLQNKIAVNSVAILKNMLGGDDE